MSQYIHIHKKKELLKKRAEIVRNIRTFFNTSNFVEITAPTVVQYPGQEPNLEPMRVALTDDFKKDHSAYLHTSPEYTLKKCLAAGFDQIYSLGPCYRNQESFGGIHNPEFTMLEWYRSHAGMEAIMDDLDALFQFVAPERFIEEIERRHMRDVWQQYVGVDLDDYLTTERMYQLCRERGYTVNPDEPYEVLFYTIFIPEIEHHLGKDIPTIIHHYPVQMAALAVLDSDDTRYAERFELYVDGVELANAFTELTDADEQRRRLVAEQQERKQRGMSVYDLDEDFLEAVGAMPPAAGIAFGVDRFVQLVLGCKNIDDVLVLPASKLFKSQDQ